VKIVRSINAAYNFCRRSPTPTALVPTMGALHAGHAALIRKARRLVGHGGTVIVSLFVNPTQFGPSEDYHKYPRTARADHDLCKVLGVDIVFEPAAEMMYPPPFSTYVDEKMVSASLCGASRPGHFQGVCTVVLKLFSITGPTFAVFGLKDFQQCMVIRRMTRDLNLPIHLEFVETVREPDGLAMSSRNRFLSRAERAQAAVVHRALLAAKSAWRRGETRASRLRALLCKTIAEAPLARIDYAEVVDSDSLTPVRKADSNTVMALAVFFGGTRLIDNLWLRK
jgi:pantoate--beta-alanine ligase